jgi:hypothetical protein
VIEMHGIMATVFIVSFARRLSAFRV